MQRYQDWHPNFPPNLQNCHDEPIRIPGAIQTFGVLLACDKSGHIRACSENAVTFFPELERLGQQEMKCSDLIEVEESGYLAGSRVTRGSRLVKVTKRKGNALYYGARYDSDGLEILEIETKPAKELEGSAAYLADMPRLMQDLRGQSDIIELTQFAAAKIRDITGFDRVMIYRFDGDWNGEVIAESKRENLESFLGLHFPASDIPPQARALYERNWIRIIPNIKYRPQRILPEKYQSIDLSDSVLRSVSPIHIKYLENMGVGASMSVSLIVDGKLWGLIACHHYADHLVPLNLRFGCEAFGQLLSWHIKTLASAEAVRIMTDGEQKLQKVLTAFSEKFDFREAAAEAQNDLFELFGCSGIILRLGQDTARLGDDPGDILTASIVRKISNRTILEPVVSDNANEFLGLKDLPVNWRAAGFMALALSPKHNYYLICTRPEVRQTVDWAGNPNSKQKTNFDDPAQRLVPRGSFELWKEMNEGRSLPWRSETVDLFKRFALLFVKIVIERKEIVEKTNHELKALNQAKDEFVAMVSHELRTPLNAIIGWTELALSGDIGAEKVPDALKIIQRNARTQNQLVSDLLDVSRIISGKMRLSVKNMRVSEVVEAVLLSFQPAADGKKIQIISHLDDVSDSIIGDPVRVQQVIWNVLSNALKFSNKNSKVFVTVRRFSSQIEVEVRDQGVGLEKEDLEKIFGRFQQVDSSLSRRAGGLGLGLAISRHIVELHGGRIEARSDGLNRGTSVHVFFPIAPVKPEEQENQLPIDDHMQASRASAAHSTRLKGQHILIVEDEKDASKFLELLIESHGAKTSVAFNGKQALELLEASPGEIDTVLSDIGMPEMDGFQLMSEIRKSVNPAIRDVATVALTAFGRSTDRVSALKAGFDSYVAKPVMQEELLTVLESICKTKARN